LPFKEEYRYMMRLKKNIHIFALAALSFILILESAPVSAAEYQWFHPNTGYVANNPLDICRAVVIEQESDPNRNETLLPETIGVYQIYSISYGGTQTFSALCVWDFLNTSALEAGIEQRSTTSGVTAYRRGDSCIGTKIYNPVTGICGQDKEMGAPDGISCVGNPISIKSGNKYQQETDYNDGAFEITRNYNSLNGLWRSSFSDNIKITSDGSQAYLSRADGGTFSYTISGERAAPDVSGSGDLQKMTSGWRYSSPAGEVLEFDTAGRLVKYLTKENAQYTISYDYSTLSVKSNVKSSKKLILALDAQGQPLQALIDGVKLVYSYKEGRLASLTKTIGKSILIRKFLYEKDDKKLLTGIVDERGVRFATWDYDTQGRAISSQHAGGAGITTVAYSKNSSAVTNELGKKTIYNYQQYLGVNRITSIIGEPSPNCPASNSSYTYTDQGRLKTRTDAKGLVTTYAYDDRGLETSRTEASGTLQARVTTTEWDPTRFVRNKVVEPTRTTVYTYDDQGRETGRQVSAR
jgi:hypothetical protein